MKKHQKIERTHVIMTADGKAESTEEARVYAQDLAIFITMMLLDDSPEVLYLGLLCEELGSSCVWKRESLHH